MTALKRDKETPQKCPTVSGQLIQKATADEYHAKGTNKT
jgi:hypothetical protein